MLQVERERLEERIRGEYPLMGGDWCADAAARIIRETDSRLEPNVRQWMEGEELEDLWFGKYCVGLILELQGGKDFLGALACMNRYLQDEERGERMIWRTRM